MEAEKSHRTKFQVLIILGRGNFLKEDLFKLPITSFQSLLKERSSFGGLRKNAWRRIR